MEHGIGGKTGLTAAYLHYQLLSGGCAAWLQCDGRHRLEGWRIYDGRKDPDRHYLWIVPEEKLPTQPMEGVFWCVTSWTGAEPPELPFSGTRIVLPA